MGRANRKGRSTHEPFIRLHRGVTDSAAWKSMSCEARALLIEVWAKHSGQNNGRIGLSHRQARNALRIGNGKVQDAFRELQERGFLVATSKGSFDWKVAAGAGRATEWELTTEPRDGLPPKATYRNWKAEQNAAPDAGTRGSEGRNHGHDAQRQPHPSASRSGNRLDP